MNIAIVLAAGSSKRMKGIDKVFFKIKNKPLILYTINVFEKHPQIQKIILVTKKCSFSKFFSLIKKYKLKKIAAVIEGGKERQDSAFCGLKEAGELKAKLGDLILFHNGGNPLIEKKEISELISATKKYKAALLGQIAKDTIKEINDDGFLTRTIDRKKIFLAQTPQAIEYGLAKRAFEKASADNFTGTDDVSLVERLGEKVKIVLCSYKNIKITTQDDSKIAEYFLKKLCSPQSGRPGNFIS